jgi:hypothetical protein
MAVAVVAFGFSVAPYYWPFGLIGTLIVAVLLGIFAVAPVYLFLKRRRLLRPWWALLAGAFLASIPAFLVMLALHVFAFLLSLGALLDGESLASILEPWIGGDLAAYSLHLAWIALWFAPFGALGAAVAWLLAFGFRWKPPHDTGEATAGTSE